MALGEPSRNLAGVAAGARDKIGEAVDVERGPIKTQSRRTRPDGKGRKTPVCNLTTDAVEVVGIEAGEKVDVHIFRGAVVITPNGDGLDEVTD